MGGETDSTNIEGQKPELSIITTVSLEHTAFFGADRERDRL
jgi:folylpolyglutamate synthase/dihydropteroate synthase